MSPQCKPLPNIYHSSVGAVALIAHVIFDWLLPPLPLFCSEFIQIYFVFLYWIWFCVFVWLYVFFCFFFVFFLFVFFFTLFEWCWSVLSINFQPPKFVAVDRLWLLHPVSLIWNPIPGGALSSSSSSSSSYLFFYFSFAFRRQHYSLALSCFLLLFFRFPHLVIRFLFTHFVMESKENKALDSFRRWNLLKWIRTGYRCWRVLIWFC